MQFVMICYILHVLRTSTPFKENPSAHFKDLCNLKLLTYFDINLTSSSGGAFELKFGDTIL